MNDAELYKKTNWCQRRDAEDILKKYSKIMNWKSKGDRTIDMGCGDGGVTVDIIRKYLPENYEILIGCDINKDMVQLASENNSDARIKFKVLDLAGVIPEDLLRSYDHVFSFYALNWVKDQTKAFKNLYNLLVDGGDCLLMLVGYHPIYTTLREVAKNNKWKHLLKDVEQHFSPYHDIADPKLEVENVVKQAGFDNVKVTCRNITYVFESFDQLRMAVSAIYPFKVPEEVYDEFTNDFMETFNRVNYKNEAAINILPSYKDYNSIVIYATK